MKDLVFTQGKVYSSFVQSNNTIISVMCTKTIKGNSTFAGVCIQEKFINPKDEFINPLIGTEFEKLNLVGSLASNSLNPKGGYSENWACSAGWKEM